MVKLLLFMQRTRLATDIRLSAIASAYTMSNCSLDSAASTGVESFRFSLNSAMWKLEIISA